MAAGTPRDNDLPLVIRFPSDEEDERIKRFRVHQNYVTSVDLFLSVLYGSNTERGVHLIDAQRALPAFDKINRRPLANERELRRLLAISWASELQLRIAAESGGAFLRYSNAWTPVHAYYAVYMTIHAWFSTLGLAGMLDDHTATLRTVVAQLVRRKLVPHPWDVSCAGHPELGERKIDGLPLNATPDAHFEALANPTIEDIYPRLAKMLETTRRDRLARNRREWLKQNDRKSMRAAEKRVLAERLAPTTLFDYLWRLRVRSNYRDVSTFLMAGLEDASHEAFHRGVLAIAGATCLLIQSLIVAYVGPKPYADALDEFIAGGGIALGSPADFLQERRELLAPGVAHRRASFVDRA